MNWRVLPFLILGACSSAARPAVDAGWDSLPRDARLPGDTPPPIPAVDFSVVNCPDTDAQKGSCRGRAPFTIQFTAVSSSGITGFSWDFGDTGLADVQAPWHTFESPGTYNITLRGWSLGATVLVQKTKEAFIEVIPSPDGSPCLRDDQCVSKNCLCSTDKPCNPGPVNGLCTNLCQKLSCPNDQVCVNLVTTAADGAETIATVPVTIGLRDNRYTQITGGLAEGDLVQIGNALPIQSFGPPTVEPTSASEE